MEQLAVPHRLGDRVRVVEAGHLLVADLGVDADDLGMLKLVDERQRVPDGGQQDVAARLVRLGLDREPQAVTVVEDVAAEDVERLLVPVQRGADVLAGPGLGALPAAPAHIHPGAKLGREVQVAHDLGQREPAHVPVVGGERALLEHRVREQVGGRGRHHQAGVGQGLLECLDLGGSQRRGRVKVEHVVVVEVDPVGAELGELADRPVGGHRRPHRRPEHIHPLPPDGPDAKREPVAGGRLVRTACGHGSVLSTHVVVASRNSAKSSPSTG